MRSIDSIAEDYVERAAALDPAPATFARLRAEQENLNRWQRQMSWVSGYGEGWATYAERLMGELGYLDDDPGAYLGMLDMQMMPAANVALDIGVHLELEIPKGTGWREGERWNAGIAWEFLRAHSSWDDKRLRFELHRYLGWPGQVPSCKLGERVWLKAREEADHEPPAWREQLDRERSAAGVPGTVDHRRRRLTPEQ